MPPAAIYCEGFWLLRNIFLLASAKDLLGINKQNRKRNLVIIQIFLVIDRTDFTRFEGLILFIFYLVVKDFLYFLLRFVGVGKYIIKKDKP